MQKFAVLQVLLHTVYMHGNNNFIRSSLLLARWQSGWQLVRTAQSALLNPSLTWREVHGWSAMRLIHLLLLYAAVQAERHLTINLILSQHGEALSEVKDYVAKARRSLPNTFQLGRVYLLSHSASTPIVPRGWSAHALGRGQASDALSTIYFLSHHLHDSAHPSHLLWFSPAVMDARMSRTAFSRLSLLSERTAMLALGEVNSSSCSGSSLAPLLQALHFAATHRFCHGDAESSWPVFGASFIVSHQARAGSACVALC